MQTSNYTIYPCGTNAITLSVGDSIDDAIYDKIMQLYHYLQQLSLKSVKDIIPAYNSVTIVYDAFVVRKINKTTNGFSIFQQVLEEALLHAPTNNFSGGRKITVPVCYDVSLGIDLPRLSAERKIPIEQFIAFHTNKTYKVYMLGFLPGFAYMGKVVPEIAAPRLAQPRTTVAAGSVGIAGEQTGIYPFASPGGWNIIGQTPLNLFDAHNASPTLFLPGDEVQFEAISLATFHRLQQEKPNTFNTATPAKGLQVLKAGIADTIRAVGRFGHQHLGIPPNSCMDMIAATTTNFLVGNDAEAAVIEMHFPASMFIVEQDCLLALSGADFMAYVDDKPITNNTVFTAKRSSVIQFKAPKQGRVCYLAVRGGFNVPKWLNSYTTNPPAKAGGWNGSFLQAGATLGFNNTSFINLKPKNNWKANLAPCYTADDLIRIIKGPAFDFLTEDAVAMLLSSTFSISINSNTMGFRLVGEALQLTQPQEMISSAVVMGTVQLLPDGSLLILMSDHQTTGGYPVVAYVAAVDLPKLAQSSIGKHISFQCISTEAAEDLYCKQQRYLQQLKLSCILRLEV